MPAVTWELAGTITVIVTAIVGAATAYLRLSIGKAVADMRSEIMEDAEKKFVNREVFDEYRRFEIHARKPNHGAG